MPGSESLCIETLSRSHASGVWGNGNVLTTKRNPKSSVKRPKSALSGSQGRELHLRDTSYVDDAAMRTLWREWKWGDQLHSNQSMAWIPGGRRVCFIAQLQFVCCI